MLSLTVQVPLKRKTLKERLHLCPKEKIIKDTFSTYYGEINIYRIYHFSPEPFFTPKRLSKALKETLYTPYSPVPKEYLKRAVLLRLIEKLKKDGGKTVFLGKEFFGTDLLGEICRYSARVYIMSDTLPENAEQIYRKYGTLPLCSAVPVVADFCPDTKEPFTVSLPEELKTICPKEFSPLLFAALIYKENQMMIF